MEFIFTTGTTIPVQVSKYEFLIRKNLFEQLTAIVSCSPQFPVVAASNDDIGRAVDEAYAKELNEISDKATASKSVSEISIISKDLDALIENQNNTLIEKMKKDYLPLDSEDAQRFIKDGTENLAEFLSLSNAANNKYEEALNVLDNSVFADIDREAFEAQFDFALRLCTAKLLMLA